MNAALQNRLVGTIIVVALVVILLPEVLDGEKVQSKQEFVDIPPAPQSIVIEEAQPFPQAALDANTQRPTQELDERPVDDDSDDPSAQNSAQASTQANMERAQQDQSSGQQTAQASQQNNTNTQGNVRISDEAQTRVAASEADIDVRDSGFVVQLGSFRYEKNVNELIATLKQAGYRAYSRPVKTNVGVLNKVFVGPELEREKLEQALPHLQELTKLKGKITAFEVSAQ